MSPGRVAPDRQRGDATGWASLERAGRWRLPSADGGADRARTGDPLVANQVLSQLSYSPSPRSWWA